MDTTTQLDTTENHPKTATVSISEAARLVGKGRQTLYNHKKQGKLSFEKDRDGSPVVQVAELMRVYGELKLPKPNEVETDKDTVKESSASQQETGKGNSSRQLDMLRKLISTQKELSMLKQSQEREREIQEERIQDLKSQVNDWKEQARSTTHLLEYQQSEQEKKSSRGWLSRLFS